MFMVTPVSFFKRPLSDLPEELEIIYRTGNPQVKVDFLAKCEETGEIIIHTHVTADPDECHCMLWRQDEKGRWMHLEYDTDDPEHEAAVNSILLDCSEFAHACLEDPESQGILVVLEYLN